jgi:hypothetical protein
LQLKLRALKDSADFYEKKGPEYKEQLDHVMNKYKRVNKKIMQELAGEDSSDEED